MVTGYYSDVHVVLDYIINKQNQTDSRNRLPSEFVVMFFRELSFLTGYFDFELLGSPTIDLTHAGNTTLKGHMNGAKALIFFGRFDKFMVRDGRGEGNSTK